MHIERPTRRSVGVGIVICVLALGIPLLSQSEGLPADMPFLDGIAWLSNDSRDEVVRVNGQTGQVDAALPLDDAQNASIVQETGVAFVEVNGEIRRIDLASLDWGESIAADGELVVGTDRAGNPRVYLLMPDGEVRVLDPATLETQATVQLDGVPGQGVVVEGRLVVTTRTDGAISVQVVEDAELVGTAEVAGPGDHVELSRIGEDIAVVNLTANQLTVLRPAGSSVEPSLVTDLTLPAGDIVVPTELPAGNLWILAPRQGELLGVDLADGQVTTRVQVTDDRADLAGPVVLGGTVYIVDRDAGTVIQVGTGGAGEGEVTEQALSDFGIDDATEAELSAVAGKVFINDPAGNMAVVFSEDGTAQGVDKFATPALTEDPEADAEADADRSDPRNPGGDRDEEQPRDRPAGDQQPQAPDQNQGPVDPPPQAPTTLPPVTAPPPPSPPVTTERPATTTTTTTTTTTLPPTTAATPPPTTAPSTTQPPTTTPPPQPPGQVALSITPGDGTAALSWTAAASQTPVTYHVSSDPAIAGQTAWQTTELSLTLTGMTNGVPYQLTVTPTNAAGSGDSSRDTVVPQGAPSVSNVTVSPSGRSMTVSFSYATNGGSLERCEVSGASTTVAANCSSGSGSATIDVPSYYTSYTFTATVQTSSGTATDDAAARSGTKSLTVDGSRSRWQGSCYWAEHGTSRPVVANPADLCLDEGPDYYVRMAPHGSTQQIQCWQRGDEIQDNPGDSSNIWLRLSDGWMSTLYFTNWTTADDNLPAC